ncbi:hypothetical protein AB1A65_09120, partial [Muricauda sp. ANG21]|uniref:hypothetical protein n=1 Tax=Allomuricauda sp. ANG21 TaxID=3042468 RepID=UPI0034569A0D
MTLTLEDGGTQTVDLSALDNSGTDDQTALEVNYDNTTSGLSSTNTQAAIDELKADVDAFAATSGQTNTASNVGAGGVGLFARKTGANLEFKNINAGSNIVVISNDAGNDEVDIDINEANLRITESQITDLTHTVDTDDQTLTLSGNTLSIADGNSVDLSALDNSGSDDQTLTLSGNSLSIEDGNNVDLSGYLDNTDDQALSSVACTILTLAAGSNVDLTPYLAYSDKQAITAFSLDKATNISTPTP